MKKTLISLLVGCASLIASAGPSILSIKQSITDDAIVYPESFETDTHRMMQNWYLKNYAVLDEGVNSLSPASVSDEELIRRLGMMPTVIEMPFNQIVRSYIVMYTERRRGLVENMLGMSLYYMPIFEQALEREGMPLELKYLPVIESALNPDAVSRAGATGLWQFMLGTAKTVKVTKDTMLIVDGAGEKQGIDERIAQIKAELERCDSDFDREKLQERLAKLSGGVAVLKVGAATESELKETKSRIEDALQATRAAVEEGIVAGGGVALIGITLVPMLSGLLG